MCDSLLPALLHSLGVSLPAIFAPIPANPSKSVEPSALINLVSREVNKHHLCIRGEYTSFCIFSHGRWTELKTNAPDKRVKKKLIRLQLLLVLGFGEIRCPSLNKRSFCTCILGVSMPTVYAANPGNMCKSAGLTIQASEDAKFMLARCASVEFMSQFFFYGNKTELITNVPN